MSVQYTPGSCAEHRQIPECSSGPKPIRRVDGTSSDDWTLLRDASLNLKPMDRVWGSPLRGKVSFHPAFLPIITQLWKAAPAASHVYDKETSTS